MSSPVGSSGTGRGPVASPTAREISELKRAAETFFCAAASASESLSNPKKSKGAFRSLARASFLSSARSVCACSERPGHRSTAKWRCSPGARRMAMSPASMSNVPEPHMGSSTGSSPVYPDARNMAAASVSFIGAAVG